MKRTIGILLGLFIGLTALHAQNKSSIAIPAYNDSYSLFVSKLEAGQTDINYGEFRKSFLKSRQYKVKREQNGTFHKFEKELNAQIEKSNYDGVVKAAKGMLGIDYTSMTAHKYLQQSYRIIGDTISSKKYKEIEFGMLHSIINSGDGKSCATSWEVTQIEEEYFIIGMVDGHLVRQSIDNSGGNLCDKMEIKTDEGEERTYYFEVSSVFEANKIR